MKALPLAWTKGIKDGDKSNFEQTLRNSSTTLNRLLSIIDEKEQSLLSSELTVNDFADPNWSHKQAFRNGQRAGLKEVRALLDFIKG